MKWVFSFLCMLVVGSVFAGPHIFCADSSWDFGERFNSGKLVREYRIENRGDEALQFGEINNCCGLTVDFPYKTLAPGSNATCKVTFSLKGRRGKQAKEVYIACNDRKNPYLTLTMNGNLREALEVEPRFIRYGPSESTGSRKVRLVSVSGDPFSITKMSCKVAGAVVSKRQVSELEWELDVRLASDFAGGKVHGLIELLTDHPDQPKLHVLMHGEVAAAVKVSPSEVVLTAGTKPVTRNVAVRASEPFKVLSATLVGAKGEVSQKALGKTGYGFSMALTPSEVTFGATLELTTDHPRMSEITVPIRVVD